MQERLKAIKKSYGSKQMGGVSVDMVIGGMRGITVSSSTTHKALLGLCCVTNIALLC